MDILPVFYEESPDPLPDRQVSGYPVSVIVNDQKLNNFKLNSFKLFDEYNIQINDVRLLTSKNDPNQILKNNQYVLFPLKRLKNDHSYRAVVNYQLGHDTREFFWVFRTRPLAKTDNIITVHPWDKEIKLPYGIEHFVLFFPPDANYPGFNSYHVSYSKGISPEIDFIDKNTLEVRIKSQIGKELKITLSDQRFIKIRIEKKA